MTALLSRVPSYTTNLTLLEVATMLELGWWSWMLRRPGRSMPEVLTMPDLGRWSRSVFWGALSGVHDCEDRLWFRPPRLFNRQCDEEPSKVIKVVARVEAGGAEGTKSCNWAS